MNVTAMGARFRSEDTVLDAVASANTSVFQGPFHYVVISKKVIDSLTAKGLKGIGMDVDPAMPPEMKPQFTLDTPWTNASQVFDAMVAGGWGYRGATLEELAQNAHMDTKTFVATYKNYNAMCAAGTDKEFGKPAKYMFSEGDEGPFYIIIAEINNLGSVGGLVINTKFQALNEKKLPVPGLYSVGVESLGVLFNDTYVGFGAGIAWTFTSGRLGGAEAAKAVLAK
jgi:fumarate reductase flavoprotein subunit